MQEVGTPNPRSCSRVKGDKPILRHILMKFHYNKDKEKTLDVSRANKTGPLQKVEN